MDFLQPFYKKDFIKQTYRVHDTSSNSPYVEFIDMPTYIGGGVSIVKFYPSTVNLHTGASFEVEVLDTEGNAVRTEVPDFRDRFGNYYVSIYVQDSTAEGYGSISFVGVANATPDGEYIEPDDVNSQGYNLIIAKSLLIQPFERNDSPLIFDRPPLVNIGQIITPARTVYTNTIRGTLDLSTKSVSASFVTSNVEGFDKVSSTSKDIQDTLVRGYAIKNRGESSTANEVITTVRQNDYDIQGGQLLSDTNRFRTILQLIPSIAVPEFKSNDKGATITLSTTNSFADVTRSLSSAAVFAKTNPYNDLSFNSETQSLVTQLNQYTATVIRVINSSSYLVDKPLQVNIESYNSTRKNSLKRTTTHTFRSAKNISTTIKYADPVNILVSQTVSQSYLQFTFQDLKPIGGSVHRIKSFYRQNSLTGDYQLISDQRVGYTEYLTEAREPNYLSYAREISPFLMYGHFRINSVISAYWRGYTESNLSFDTIPIARDAATLMDSAYLPVATPTNTTVFTTRGYQIYQSDQAFSFSFICVLEPNTTLEVYANSKAVSTQIYDSSPFAEAFDLSKNNDKVRYQQADSRFGKFVGSITNNTGERKDYGRVVFDLLANNDGYGRPLFRVKSTNQVDTAGAYLSEISVTPLQRNGYTPEIFQYVVNAPAGYESLVSESVDYKFEYYDHTGKQSEFVTYINGLNLSLTSEIEGNICEVENYKFVFNPTHWSLVTESATFRNTFIAPYNGNPNQYYTVQSSPTFNTNNAYYRSHSFAQVSNTTTAGGFLIAPDVNDYISRGWGKPTVGDILTSITGSTVSSNSRRRRYFPAYDQMHAQTSFEVAYGKAIYQPPTFVKVGTYGYGVGSAYDGPDATQHTWSGWNALRPWKPIFAHKWLNKTNIDDLTGTVYSGRFVYTSSWEIYPALGQPINTIGAIAPSNAPAPENPGITIPPIKATPVTASWRFFDEFSERYVQPFGQAMLIDSTNPAVVTNATTLTASFNRVVISASYAPTAVTPIESRLGTSSFDLQYPVNSGAAGITRFHVSQSYVTTSGAFTTAQKATAYKQRRFYFPFSGPMTGSVFTENGGIYNVKFRLKRYQSGSNSQNWFVPDTGSHLMVYLFDVSSPFDGALQAGQPGYYPPAQNIVKIGNQITTNGFNIPAITFYDSASGYLYDEYDINLIQYGAPAQLVFEPSGTDESYFACALDDVEFCKIGTTTDPYYIKPPAS